MGVRERKSEDGGEKFKNGEGAFIRLIFYRDDQIRGGIAGQACSIMGRENKCGTKFDREEKCVKKNHNF